ncbi:MAG TPA: protein translocase subunit SecD [Rhabdochlamydiaceae bacterium]|nr:protein translocase subunit SecD [Rhabdochlamydiaceae bacterium]
MDKQKRWQRFLIFGVILLTVYNILPTVFYYTKSLKSPIDQTKAAAISQTITQRVDSLEEDTKQWLKSFCKLLGIKPVSIAFSAQNPEFYSIAFSSAQDAAKFRTYLPRAGSLISFVPKQLSLYDSSTTGNNVIVQRKIPLHFSKESWKDYFQFAKKINEQGQPTFVYRTLIDDRSLQLGIALGGPSENAQMLLATLSNPNDSQNQELVVRIAQNILSFVNTFGENAPITKRYFASFTQVEGPNRESLFQNFVRVFEQTKDQLKLERINLQSESQSLQTKGAFLELPKQQRLQLLTQHEKTLQSADALIKRHAPEFSAGKTPFNYSSLGALLEQSHATLNEKNKLQIISLDGRNPFISEFVIDWANEKIDLKLYPDLLAFKAGLQNGTQTYLRDQVDQILYNEIAYDSRLANEIISPVGTGFQINLSHLQSSKTFLALPLSKIAQVRAKGLKETLLSNWQPKHPDLTRDSFPIWDYETYLNLPAEQKKLGLIVYAPSMQNKMPPSGFRMSSIYVIAKGLDKVVQKLQASSQSEEAALFMEDFNALKELLKKNGLFGYSGNAFPFSREYAQDFIFEDEDYYQTLLKATREDFTVNGTKRFAVLEFTDVEQRLLTENKIDDHIQEDLLKWRDDYYAAKMELKGAHPYDVPAPTQSPFFQNLKLSTTKYFRGDNRKILHWGLDLSGGKTVQIELRDSNNRVVSGEAELRQGINELYNRVNKMGVSEISIRQEGNFITLDFPGSQNISASELVKASSMYFYVVNEKFNMQNPNLADVSSLFLHEIWNEAVVTGRKGVEDINLIAWKHLHGESADPDLVQPRSESAKILYENGLRLANPLDSAASSNFNDVYSQVAVMRGDDFTDWHGQTHPLMIVFRNFAVEGSNLKNIQASYDPSKGNFLAFEIKSSQVLSNGQKLSPRDDLYAWTSQFSKEKIAGTANATFSRGQGWRMAVILNGSVISSPTLDAALKDSAMISGSFTQREINQLEADLKAGSLSYTPRILSEKNVSPELGSKERLFGILAMALSLILVILTMLGIYRFAGLVASFAVLFNLLIMWGTLQNISATLTLASIAGVILAVAMAVDANVLVFERFREEFSVSGRIGSALHAAYQKAFSAILDSNVTTIIAALILLHFDSGPIKGFALTLIIGIVSSMFTALFVTRYYFTKWAQNPEHKTLNMTRVFKPTHFNFLKLSKLVVLCTGITILIGAVFFVKERHTIFGMDFTGGYSLNIELVADAPANYRARVEEALLASGASSQNFQIRELSPSNHIRIFLGKGMQQPGKPFFGMPVTYDLKEYTYAYQTNPRIDWVVQALNKGGLKLAPYTLTILDQNWSEVSGQLSDSMKKSASIGLLIALVCILCYITLRFEFKYAASAIISLAHSVFISLGMIAILHALKLPLQIDLNTVAALMTIVGYSLNDTIIIFDRIREDVRLMRKSSFEEIVNHALNATLTRTMMTSGITLLALLPLVLLGGSTIFTFAFMMIVGVIFGTLSSLFVAAPLMVYFHNKQQEKNKNSLPQVVV